MKRILLIFGSLKRAGAQMRSLSVCKRLQDRYDVQFDICWLGLGPNDLNSELHSIVGNMYYLPIKSPRFIFEYIRLLRQNDYDAVNVFARFFSPFLLWLAKLNNIKVRIASIRNAIGLNERGLSNPMVLRIYRLSLTRLATDIVGVSRTTLDDVFPEQWRGNSHFHIIYNGFELPSTEIDEMNRRRLRGEVRKEFGWLEDTRIVIHVGRFALQKNHVTIIKSIQKANQLEPTLRLLLVGDGPLLEQATYLLHEQKIDRIAALAGRRNDVLRLLEASDVFFFPSRWEGLPGALIEALGVGLPVVASDIPQIKEVASYLPGTFRLAPPNDFEQHADNLLLALNGTTDLIPQWQRFAQSPFSMESCIQEYARLYGCVQQQ